MVLSRHLLRHAWGTLLRLQSTLGVLGAPEGTRWLPHWEILTYTEFHSIRDKIHAGDPPVLMKTVILAGGLGTRLAEETDAKPKPMVEIGGRPILWHVMKHYAHYGFNEFIVALGYKGECIKRHFLDYHALNSNITVDLATGNITNHNQQPEPWLVHLVDTGGETNTGGRVKRLQGWWDAGTFMVTYGDGVADVNLRELLEFHYASRAVATVTAVRPPAR